MDGWNEKTHGDEAPGEASARRSRQRDASVQHVRSGVRSPRQSREIFPVKTAAHRSTSRQSAHSPVASSLRYRLNMRR